MPRYLKVFKDCRETKKKNLITLQLEPKVGSLIYFSTTFFKIKYVFFSLYDLVKSNISDNLFTSNFYFFYFLRLVTAPEFGHIIILVITKTT